MGTPYGGVIAGRFRHPRFRGPLAAADLSGEALNPLCGDRIRIELAVRDGVITAARHLGDACAICVAAADLLAEMVEGASCEAAMGTSPDALAARMAAPIGPSRRQCVMLPVTALRSALEQGR
jgi:nitrogen fixation NifU-like protein